jgi:hypothetical protein
MYVSGGVQDQQALNPQAEDATDNSETYASLRRHVLASSLLPVSRSVTYPSGFQITAVFDQDAGSRKHHYGHHPSLCVAAFCYREGRNMTTDEGTITL